MRARDAMLLASQLLYSLAVDPAARGTAPVESLPRADRDLSETRHRLTGWLLGGTQGPATVVYALLVGPLVHLLLPLVTVPAGRHEPEARSRGTGPRCESRSGTG